MKLRAILSLPAAYRLFRRLVGAHRLRVAYTAEYIRPTASDRVLDCGCGPGDFVTYLPGVDYVGIDMDEGYISSARAKYGDRGSFRLGPVSAETMGDEAHYDLVLANGLLHHLDDVQVSEFLRLAARNLKPSGYDRRLLHGGSVTHRENAPGYRSGLAREKPGCLARAGETGFPGRPAAPQDGSPTHPYTHLVMECPAPG